MAGLFKTYGKRLRFDRLFEPEDQGFDALRCIIESIRNDMIRADEVTEEICFPDIDAQKEG